MTDNQLIEIIDEINKFPNHGSDFVRQSIAIDVDIINYWGTYNVSKFYPYTIFLIKKNNIGIGAVLDMNSELHWVLKPEFRGKKLMSKALRDVVLPYIFFHLKRSCQEISIYESDLKEENYNASKNLALAIGFYEKSPNKFICECQDYNKKDSKINIKHNGLNPNEIKTYEKEIENVVRDLLKLKAKLEAAYTSSEIKSYSKKLPLEKICETLICFRYNFDEINHASVMNNNI